jgi:ABC-type taurine transport system ATPase subunit
MVFGPEYAFKIDFRKSRGRTEANLILLRNGHEIEDALNEDSGGVCDVASFGLRLSCLLLIKPKLRKILIMDEPFKNVHSEIYRERVREMIVQLSEKFKMQFIIVTGIDDFIVGDVVRL